MNSAIISGRLCRDPEVRYSGTGDKTTAIATFCVAVNRSFAKEGEPNADFFNVTAFGKSANFAEKYLRQGMKVVIRGSMRNDSYTNKDGQKVYTWKLIAEEIDFGESKQSSDSNRSGSKEPKLGKKTNVEPKVDENGFMDIPEELMADMPFN